MMYFQVDDLDRDLFCRVRMTRAAIEVARFGKRIF